MLMKLLIITIIAIITLAILGALTYLHSYNMVTGKGYIDTGIGLGLDEQEQQEYINEQVKRQPAEQTNLTESIKQESNIELGKQVLFGPRVQCDFVFKDGIEGTITRYFVRGYTCEEWKEAVNSMTSIEYMEWLEKSNQSKE